MLSFWITFMNFAIQNQTSPMSSCNQPGSLKAALTTICAEVPILTSTNLKTITDALCSILKVGWRRVKLLSPSILFDAQFQQGFLESSWNSVACLWSTARLVYLSDIKVLYNPISQVSVFAVHPQPPAWSHLQCETSEALNLITCAFDSIL